MEQIKLDVGIKSFQLVEGGELLKFNPSDPNVYTRFFKAMSDIDVVEKEMAAKAKAISAKDNSHEELSRVGTESIVIMEETDRRIKNILNGVFGVGNNFDNILLGVNLMAVTGTGNRVISNLLEALLPIMEKGAQNCINSEINAAKQRRDQRRSTEV